MTQIRKSKEHLFDHVNKVKNNERPFETAFETVSRMILDGEDKIRKVNVNGKRTLDYTIFRKDPKPLVGMYNEINSFVSYIKDAAEGGSSSEMAFVMVSEPGTGKTYFADYLCRKYREFVSFPENRKYTFKFRNLDELGNYGALKEAESQTYEDPMILALNLFEDYDETKKFLQEQFKFTDKEIYNLFSKHRPLGACSDYIWNDILEHVDGDVNAALDNYVTIFPVPLTESLGTLTGKYPAKDKITSSSVDLLGEESIQRLLHITDTNNPYRFDLRRGALARVAGGGIHFSDEIFKNKRDLIQVYLSVIQNRTIELDGFRWPIDSVIIATSNNSEFDSFLSEKEEAPIVDRCRICYVSHNTDYNLQKQLTDYAIGDGMKHTVDHEDLHFDPNLNYAVSVAVVLTRLPDPRDISEKLSRTEMLKLAAGEVAGDKSVKTLSEVISDLAKQPDIEKRFGQTGLGQRNIGRALQIQREMAETNEGKCMFALHAFDAFEQVIYDYVNDAGSRDKYIEDLKVAKEMYREEIQKSLFNAYMGSSDAIEAEVLSYVNMVIGIAADDLGPDDMWRYKDPATGEMKSVKIDRKFIDSVEERLNLKTNEQKETFRTQIRQLYGQKISTDPTYKFMDNDNLVKAVTEVRLKSDVAAAGSLVGALANRANEENEKLYNRVLNAMIDKPENGGLGYCNTCAQKTIEYFCNPEDT